MVVQRGHQQWINDSEDFSCNFEFLFSTIMKQLRVLWSNLSILKHQICSANENNVIGLRLKHVSGAGSLETHSLLCFKWSHRFCFLCYNYQSDLNFPTSGSASSITFTDSKHDLCIGLDLHSSVHIWKVKNFGNYNFIFIVVTLQLHTIHVYNILRHAPFTSRTLKTPDKLNKAKHRLHCFICIYMYTYLLSNLI